jgi:hypothetical protein
MPKSKVSTASVKKIGRDSGTGEFIPVAKAKKKPQTTIVERVDVKAKKVGKKKATKKSQ